MRQEKIKLEPNGATLTTYIHNDDELRNGILIFPGGAYMYCSPAEGEPVALTYYNLGFNTFVLEYTCKLGLYGSPKAEKEEVFDSALEDAMNAYYYVKEHHDDFKINENKISILGFSAGAHLALSSVNIGGLKPLSLMLGYGAFSNEMDKGLEIKENNLFDRVRDDNPPTFMFLCQADSVVPAKESLKLASIYADKKIPFELHCYVAGDHGLSIGTRDSSGVVNEDFATWIDHSVRFLKNIQRDTPLILGDISEDLKEISVYSRIGALMHNEEAWKVIKEMLPEIAENAENNGYMLGLVLERLWRRGYIDSPSQEEVDKRLREIKC